MFDDIDRLQSLDISEILKSAEYSKLLLKTYSKLFLGGGQPDLCTSCMRGYYTKIIKNGKMKAKLLEQIKTRKCIPAFSGKKYIPSIMKGGKLVTVHQHINSDLLTDELALELLASGALNERDFKILPAGVAIQEVKDFKVVKKRPSRKKAQIKEENNDLSK